MRLIDADRLLSNKMKTMYYHLPNGDVAIPLIDIEHAPTVNEWISVDDRLPDARNDEYLVAVETKHDREHYTTTDHWVSQLQHWYIYDEKSEAVVTHWMPFPEPPKGESDD